MFENTGAIPHPKRIDPSVKPADICVFGAREYDAEDAVEGFTGGVPTFERFLHKV